ncbi:hypothetical protein LPJ73_002821, partial [Coemansia sp. RSA 2703]
MTQESSVAKSSTAAAKRSSSLGRRRRRGMGAKCLSLTPWAIALLFVTQVEGSPAAQTTSISAAPLAHSAAVVAGGFRQHINTVATQVHGIRRVAGENDRGNSTDSDNEDSGSESDRDEQLFKKGGKGHKKEHGHEHGHDTNPYGSNPNPYAHNPYAQNPYATQPPHQPYASVPYPTVNPYPFVDPAQAVSPAQAANPAGVPLPYPYPYVIPTILPAQGAVGAAAQVVQPNVASNPIVTVQAVQNAGAAAVPIITTVTQIQPRDGNGNGNGNGYQNGYRNGYDDDGFPNFYSTSSSTWAFETAVVPTITIMPTQPPVPPPITIPPFQVPASAVAPVTVTNTERTTVTQSFTTTSANPMLPFTMPGQTTIVQNFYGAAEQTVGAATACMPYGAVLPTDGPQIQPPRPSERPPIDAGHPDEGSQVQPPHPVTRPPPNFGRGQPGAPCGHVVPMPRIQAQMPVQPRVQPRVEPLIQPFVQPFAATTVIQQPIFFPYAPQPPPFPTPTGPEIQPTRPPPPPPPFPTPTGPQVQPPKPTPTTPTGPEIQPPKPTPTTPTGPEIQPPTPTAPTGPVIQPTTPTTDIPPPPSLTEPPTPVFPTAPTGPVIQPTTPTTDIPPPPVLTKPPSPFAGRTDPQIQPTTMITGSTVYVNPTIYGGTVRAFGDEHGDETTPLVRPQGTHHAAADNDSAGFVPRTFNASTVDGALDQAAATVAHNRPEVGFFSSSTSASVGAGAQPTADAPATHDTPAGSSDASEL